MSWWPARHVAAAAFLAVTSIGGVGTGALRNAQDFDAELHTAVHRPILSAATTTLQYVVYFDGASSGGAS